MNFNYQGEVSIKINKTEYKYKNSGSPSLFEYISRYLSGENLPQTLIIPSYIKLHKDSATGDIESIENIPVLRKFKMEDSKPVTILTSTIVQQNLPSTLSTAPYYLVLYNNRSIRLASVQIEKNILDRVITGKQAVIEWSLKFDNSGPNQGATS